MQIYYVATLSRYVLVSASTEQEAREAGLDALVELYRLEGHEACDIPIITVRLASADEIEIQNWHKEEGDTP